MIIEAIINDLKIIEIPINYGKRRGYSKITSNFKKSFILGIKMILLIFKKWFKYVFKNK
jgi:hypothetical protein